MESLAPYLAPIVTGLIAAISVYVAMSSRISVLETKIDALSERVEKHNNVIERTYRLESQVEAIETRLNKGGQR